MPNLGRLYLYKGDVSSGPVLEMTKNSEVDKDTTGLHKVVRCFLPPNHHRMSQKPFERVRNDEELAERPKRLRQT